MRYRQSRDLCLRYGWPRQLLSSFNFTAHAQPLHVWQRCFHMSNSAPSRASGNFALPINTSRQLRFRDSTSLQRPSTSPTTFVLSCLSWINSREWHLPVIPISGTMQSALGRSTRNKNLFGFSICPRSYRTRFSIWQTLALAASNLPSRINRKRNSFDKERHRVRAILLDSFQL